MGENVHVHVHVTITLILAAVYLVCSTDAFAQRVKLKTDMIFGKGRVAWIDAKALTAASRFKAQSNTQTAKGETPPGKRRSASTPATRRGRSAPDAPAVPSLTIAPLDTRANHDRVRGRYGAMRYDITAATGACTLKQVRTDAQARALLAYYEIETPGSTATERLNLANGLFQASALYGGRFPPFVGLTIKFKSRRGLSRYIWDPPTVDLNRCDRWGNRCGAGSNINIARLTHELGHAAVARSTREATYAKTFRGCIPTGYSRHHSGRKRNENAAELFSAYLTRPTLLKNGSRSCQKAYHYYATEVFAANGQYASCDTLPKQQLLARIQGLNQGHRSVTAATYKTVFARPERVVAAAAPRSPGQTAVTGSASAR
ncbi:MAG: hypothetical protein AB7P49_13895 [Bdellovibrionales bacterium]